MRSIEQLRRIPESRWEAELTQEEARILLNYELDGYDGELPVEVLQRREKALDSPSYLATEILDPWYKQKFERVHYQWLDEVMAPWAIGETARWQGSNYDSKQYTGLIVLGSRGMLKSTGLRILLQWYFPYIRLRGTWENGKEDARVMLAHHVIEKAVEHSVAIRETARSHDGWRECLPEFKAPRGEWDTKGKWRWPNFRSFLATEFSLVCYGQSSSKVGGHYTLRAYDDWVDEDSVTTDTMLEDSYQRFVQMDNLRDRTRKLNPQIAAGTHYHYLDTYKRLENQGGWLVLRMPAHTGSAKKIFEIASMPWKTQEDSKKVEAATRKLEKNPPGTLNFPHLIDWRECLRSARAQGAHHYNTQLLLNPMPEGEQRFNREVLAQSWRPQIPGPEEMWIYIRCDPAISEKRLADECAIVVGGVKYKDPDASGGAERWLIGGWVGREKRPTPIVRMLFSFARFWQKSGYRVRSIGIESVAYQEALAGLCRDGVPEREPQFSGERIPVLKAPCPIRSIPRKKTQTKHERILDMDGPVTRREVVFWTENPIGTKTMDQFLEFPFGRDDILDATHDLWEDAWAPPQPVGVSEPGAPTEWIKAINRRKRKMERKGNAIPGTYNVTRLSRWGTS